MKREDTQDALVVLLINGIRWQASDESPAVISTIKSHVPTECPPQAPRLQTEGQGALPSQLHLSSDAVSMSPHEE